MMVLHRLIGRFWPTRPFLRRKARAANRTALDLDEFGRLLSSGKPEDVQKSARDLALKSPEPISELRRWVDARTRGSPLSLIAAPPALGQDRYSSAPRERASWRAAASAATSPSPASAVSAISTARGFPR